MSAALFNVFGDTVEYDGWTAMKILPGIPPTVRDALEADLLAYEPGVEPDQDDVELLRANLAAAEDANSAMSADLDAAIERRRDLANDLDEMTAKVARLEAMVHFWETVG